MWTHTQAWRYSKPIIYCSVTLVFPLQTWDKIQFQHRRRRPLWPSHEHWLSHPGWVGVSPQGEDGAFYSKSPQQKKKHLAPDPQQSLLFLLLLKASELPLIRNRPANRNTRSRGWATFKLFWGDGVNRLSDDECVIWVCGAARPYSTWQFSLSELFIKIQSETQHREGARRNVQDLRTAGLTSQTVMLAPTPAFDLFVYQDEPCLKNTPQKRDLSSTKSKLSLHDWLY